jgi:hypothetical protein
MQRAILRTIRATAAGIGLILPISSAAQSPASLPPAIEMFEIRAGCLNPADQSSEAAVEACVVLPAIFSGQNIAGHSVNSAPNSLNGLYLVVLAPDARVQFEAYTRTHYGSQISWSIRGHLLPPMRLQGVISTGVLAGPRNPVFDKELLKTPDLTEVIRDCSSFRQRHSAIKCS